MTKTPEEVCKLSEDAFGYIKEVVNAPRDEVLLSCDYYQGFMHGVTAFMAHHSECEEGDDIGEFLLRKWLSVKDERK